MFHLLAFALTVFADSVSEQYGANNIKMFFWPIWTARSDVTNVKDELLKLPADFRKQLSSNNWACDLKSKDDSDMQQLLDTQNTADETVDADAQQKMWFWYRQLNEASPENDTVDGKADAGSETDSQQKMWFWYRQLNEAQENGTVDGSAMSRGIFCVRLETEGPRRLNEDSVDESNDKMFFWPIWTKSSDSPNMQDQDSVDESNDKMFFWPIWTKSSDSPNMQDQDSVSESNDKMFFWPIWTKSSDSPNVQDQVNVSDMDSVYV